MSIRYARPGDHPQLKALWMAAFLDDPASTDFFFAERHQDQNMLVEAQGDRVRGMLSMLPIELSLAGERHKARYFFGIATEESQRGQGISSALIKEALQIARAEGCVASILVPATLQLFGFYRKRGYEKMFNYIQTEISADALPPPGEAARLYVPTAAEMLRLRDKAFAGSRLYARWGEQALAYVLKAARIYQAALLAFRAGEAEGYLYGEWDGKRLIVKEMALCGIAPREALALLHGQLQAERYVLRLKEGAIEGQLVPYAMIQAFEPLEAPGEAPYMGLGKD